ncbi:MAG: YkgJ family cysteine cluster protein [Proteobacteria bacterium]|nr:YkgJ family cysteine cluster protein [Pseudomonadota bacterium]
MMRVDIQLNGPIGVLELCVDLPRDPVTAHETMPIMYQLADLIVARVLEEQTVTCRAACNACCVQLVPVVEPEMRALAELIGQMPQVRRRTIIQRFEKVEQAIHDAGLVEQLRQPPADAESYDALMERYFRLGQACPFLEGEGCGIYEWRPTICREYNVIGPASACGDPFHNRVSAVAMPTYLAGVIAAGLTRAQGRKTKVTPLSLARQWVSENPDAGPRRAALAWLEIFWSVLEGWSFTSRMVTDDKNNLA